MKKIIISIIILAGLIVVLMPHLSILYKKKDVISIAVPGPFGGEEPVGQEMIDGINLYLDTINSCVSGRKIVPIPFDDRNDRQTALKIASHITESGKVLIVLGHYYSASSSVAGAIYKKSGIPAITASATADSITEDNDWYFRVIPGNRFMGRFMAEYIHRVLKVSSVSIIFDEDEYGVSLKDSFEEAALSLGIKVNKRWSFDREDKSLHQRINNISAELRSVTDPGMIICATHISEGVRILASLKYPGTTYKVIGPDSFAGSAFLNQFLTYPKERLSPGYYSDGIYALSPYIPHIADESAALFQKAFIKKYKREPSWIAACYYDSMLVAAQAIERAEIHGTDVREDRLKVKDALSRFNGQDTIIKGITGNISFDEKGNSDHPLAVGLYDRHLFIPAFSQYRTITDSQHHSDIISINNQNMAHTQIIYVGIDIGEVRNLNVKYGTYTFDFYIWFRFEGQFDEKGIQFTNAVNHVDLGKPVMEETIGNITTRAYRIKSDFKSSFNFFYFPFEDHLLSIRFIHPGLMRSKLIFVPDILGMPNPVEKKNVGKSMINAITGWNIHDSFFYQDVLQLKIAGDKTAPFSRFNAEIKIKRREPSFALKMFLPLLMMFTMIYITFFMPADFPVTRILIAFAVVCCGAVFHLKFFPGTKMVIAYIFFILYAVALMSVAISLLVNKYNKYEKKLIVKWLNQTGRIFYPLLSIGGSLFVYLIGKT